MTRLSQNNHIHRLLCNTNVVRRGQEAALTALRYLDPYVSLARTSDLIVRLEFIVQRGSAAALCDKPR